MKNSILLAISSATLLSGSLAACTSGDTVTGTRSDGLEVTCEGQGEDLSKCTPADGDNACETWEDGGAATVLWPPNHKLVRFTLEACGAVVDECEPEPQPQPEDPGPINLTGGVTHRAAAPVAITSITADEAIEVGQGGDGNTGDYDVAIIDDVTFDLRSERQGGGDGRVYRVHFLDEDNNAGFCEFLVPHDRGPVSGAVDSGTQVTVEP